jgi:hypothetical protein
MYRFKWILSNVFSFELHDENKLEIMEWNKTENFDYNSIGRN